MGLRLRFGLLFAVRLRYGLLVKYGLEYCTRALNRKQTQHPERCKGQTLSKGQCSSSRTPRTCVSRCHLSTRLIHLSFVYSGLSEQPTTVHGTLFQTTEATFSFFTFFMTITPFKKMHLILLGNLRISYVDLSQYSRD